MVEQIDRDAAAYFNNYVSWDSYIQSVGTREANRNAKAFALARSVERVRIRASLREPEAALVEAVAKGICRSDPLMRMGDANGVVEQRVRHEWLNYTSEATAALSAAADAMEVCDEN
jgi:hypothetical protein